ncbi:PhzF family phenazine biosynthesis protein [Robiginitomaculum antarcticum]|uniref:PhzF family phenazine biosynthesis protein n=1 Tax=Robiginitomaculum antarcticum TaxID=437507 RepID=UPI000374B195|nr:PhzF family phenazine biosynthesis protein [Robiginitomaculum antarcticum]
MELPIYQADAFTSDLFKGNPAAVIPCEAFPMTDMMQAIAMENNLSETAFVVPRSEGWYIRWFTPMVEIEFCGHATVAAAHILRTELGAKFPLRLQAPIGPLTVNYDKTGYHLDAPAYALREIEITDAIKSAFPIEIEGGFAARDNIYIVTRDAHTVRDFKPNFRTIAALGDHGVGLTAPGDEDYDFTSRMFFPAIDLDEDPVTGSAHCALGPYWAQRLGKSELTAHQASKRGGHLTLEVSEDRVLLTGKAVTYLRGEISV